MAVQLVSANFPVAYWGPGKLATKIEGLKPEPNRWIVGGTKWAALLAGVAYFTGLDHIALIAGAALIFGITYVRRNSTYSKWQSIPREEISEVKVVADESRVKIGSRIAFGILATQSREALVSVALRDGRKALFKTDRNSLPDMLALGH